MSQKPDVSSEIYKWISENLHIDLADVQAKADAPIRDMVDSIAMINLLYHIEETFSVKIEDDEISPENFETISSIANFVETKKLA